MTAIINAEWLAFAVNCKNRLSPPSAEGSHCAGTGTNAERHGWSKWGESVLVLSHNGGIHVTDPPLLLRLRVQRGRRGGEICRGNSLGGPRTRQCPLATAGLPCSLTHSSYGWLNQAWTRLSWSTSQDGGARGSQAAWNFLLFSETLWAADDLGVGVGVGRSESVFFKDVAPSRCIHFSGRLHPGVYEQHKVNPRGSWRRRRKRRNKIERV